jgi:hypothetical protein
MNKFNKLTKTVLGESFDPWYDIFRKVSSILSTKGLKAQDHKDVLDVVNEAIQLGYKEGYKAAEKNLKTFK